VTAPRAARHLLGLCVATTIGAGCTTRIQLGSEDAGAPDDRGDAEAAPQPRPCATHADSTGTALCASALHAGCRATGTCVDQVFEGCNSAPTAVRGCGCQGVEVEWFTGCGVHLPPTYAPAPIAFVGYCDGGSSEGDASQAADASGGNDAAEGGQ
jgi:hypothetical protein